MAAEVASTGGLQSDQSHGSCTSCHRRKIKCDRVTRGCSNCTKSEVPCTYDQSSSDQRKRKRGPYQKGKTGREKELEHVLSDVKDKYNELSNTLTYPPSVSVASDDEIVNKPSTLDVASSLADVDAAPTATSGLGARDAPLSDRFWSTFPKDFNHIHRAVDESSTMYNRSGDNSPILISSDGANDAAHHDSFVFGPIANLRHLHPSSALILEYWHIYTAKVEPMVRLLHPPSFAKQVMTASADLDHLSRGMEALMFSIYFAAITSSPAAEVQLRFSMSKVKLLHRFEDAIRKALGNAGFMASRDLMTLQALVIYLLCLRRQDKDDMLWTLIGVSVRIAQLMNLSGDKSGLQLSPFQVQLRRRLWWTICWLEARAAEEYGFKPSNVGINSQESLPLNVNDDDLYPEATEAPQPRSGFTEMSLPLIRFDIMRLVTRIHSSHTLSADNAEYQSEEVIQRKITMVEDCQAGLRSKYLQHMNASRPFDWMTMTFIQVMIAKCRLLIYHPLDHAANRPLSPNLRDEVFTASIDIIQYSHAIKTDPRIDKWAWFFRTYVQWHALAYVMAELGHRTGTPEVDRAWQVLEDVLRDQHTKQSGNEQSALWQPLKWLIRRARGVREADLKLRSSSTSQVVVQGSLDEYTDYENDLAKLGTSPGLNNGYSQSLAPMPLLSTNTVISDTPPPLSNMGQSFNSNDMAAILHHDAGSSYHPIPLLHTPMAAISTSSGPNDFPLDMVDGSGMNDFDIQSFINEDRDDVNHFQQLSSEDWMSMARSWNYGE